MTKEECSLYGGETDGVNTLSLCATQRRYREAPACYKCNSSTYLWGNYSPVSSCTKTSLTYENCKTPTYSCYICDVNSNGSKGYSWGTSAPSETCKSGSWYKSNTILQKQIVLHQHVGYVMLVQMQQQNIFGKPLYHQHLVHQVVGINRVQLHQGINVLLQQQQLIQ